MRSGARSVRGGWKALKTHPAWAPFFYYFELLRGAKAGRVLLGATLLAPFLIAVTLLDASVQEVRKKVQVIQKIQTKARVKAKVLEMRGDTTILILGTDTNQEGAAQKGRSTRGRSDTMILLNVQYRDRKLRALSIPRDSFVMVDYGKGIRGDKIAHAFRRGKIGWEASKASVERLTRLSIDNFVLVDYDLFRDFIDMIGGVPLEIEKRMFYQDKAGGLYIDFHPGPTVLSGQKALEYVRFRKDRKGDVGRIERQQKFLRAAAGKLLSSPTTLLSLLKPETMSKLFDHVRTDFRPEDLLPLVKRFATASPSCIEFKTAPGDHHLRRTRWSKRKPLSYFFIDRDHLDSTLDGWFLSQPRSKPSTEEAEARAFDEEASQEVVDHPEPEPAPKLQLPGNARLTPTTDSLGAESLTTEDLVEVLELGAQGGDLPPPPLLASGLAVTPLVKAGDPLPGAQGFGDSAEPLTPEPLESQGFLASFQNEDPDPSLGVLPPPAAQDSGSALFEKEVLHSRLPAAPALPSAQRLESGELSSLSPAQPSSGRLPSPRVLSLPPPQPEPILPRASSILDRLRARRRTWEESRGGEP